MELHGQDKGFSLIEVLIALSVLTIGILAVISMQITAMKVQSRSKLSSSVQFATQQILEKVLANSISDTAVLSYSGLNTQSTAPSTEPAKTDHPYFITLLSGIPGGRAEITITNTRPYPVQVTVYWAESLVNHKLRYSTYVLPH
jgi:type IV pilus assembly protein PilV